MDVKWIKIVTDIFDDEKMLLIDGLPEHDGIIVIWFKLLCMAGKQNNGGVLMMNDKIAYTDEMLAIIFRRPINTVRLALKTFEQFGMIEIVNNAITIPNWEKHQSLDKLEKVKEQNRKRVAAHREKQKLLALSENETKCNDYCNVTVTECNATDKIREDKNRIDKEKNKDIEDKPKKKALQCNTDVTYNVAQEKEIRDRDKSIEKDIDKEKEKKKSASRFQAPTLEEVREYCIERNNNVDYEKFIDYYTANGWKVGKNSMKDWKAAVRTWERNGYSNGNISNNNIYQNPTMNNSSETNEDFW